MSTAKKYIPKKIIKIKPEPKKAVEAIVVDEKIQPAPKVDKKVYKDRRPKCKKCGKYKGKGEDDCECGRPLFNGKDVKTTIAKLESVFAVSGSDDEACFYADISHDALYRYERENPEFRNRKRMLKEKLVLVGRTNISKVMDEKDIAGNPTDRAITNTWKYLEAKKRAEFGKVIGIIADDGEGVLTEERKAEIAGAMKNWSEPEDGDERDEDYENPDK